MGTSSTSSSLCFLPPSSQVAKAFLLGVAAGAAVGCCATAAVCQAACPLRGRSSSRRSTNRDSSSRTNEHRSDSSTSDSSTSDSGGSAAKVATRSSCLRQLLWWMRPEERSDAAVNSWGCEEEAEAAKAGEEEAAAAGGGFRAAAEEAAGASSDAAGAAAAAEKEEEDEEAATAAPSVGDRRGGGGSPGEKEEQRETQEEERRSGFDAAAAAEKGEACPGPDSKDAGAAAACAGCPNRQICSSGSNSSREAAKASKNEIATKLAAVKRKVLILSGKGGVGKSTVTSQLGWTAAARGLRVGILDVDVCGPSIPLMTHARQGEVHQSAEGWQPVYVHSNLAVMSIGFLLPDPDAAVIWRGPKKNGLIHQFLADVLWGDLDLLLIDTPPGTSDEHLSIVSMLDVDGALVVTTPQEAALQDVRKEINFCLKVGVKVLGVVENMADSVFSLVDVDGAKKMCTQMKVPYAGSVPLDASLLRACEEGVAAVEKYADQPGSEALQKLMSALLEMLALPQHREEDEDD